MKLQKNNRKYDGKKMKWSKLLVPVAIVGLSIGCVTVSKSFVIEYKMEDFSSLLEKLTILDIVSLVGIGFITLFVPIGMLYECISNGKSKINAEEFNKKNEELLEPQEMILSKSLKK